MGSLSFSFNSSEILHTYLVIKSCFSHMHGKQKDKTTNYIKDNTTVKVMGLTKETAHGNTCCDSYIIVYCGLIYEKTLIYMHAQ